MQSVLKFLSIVTLAALPLAASAQDQCSHETLQVRGTPVSFALCATPGPVKGGEVAVPITATITGPGGTATDHKTLRFVQGVGPGRVLDNFDLSRIGLQGTLHLTLAYSNGSVSIESALLTPGAVQIK